LRVSHLILPCLAALALAWAPGAAAATGAAAIPTTSASSPSSSGDSGTAGSASGGAGTASGGAGVAAAPAPASTPQHPIVYGYKGKIVGGLAYAPSLAPAAVQQAIWAGDAIRHKPYIYGGGHGVWNDGGYDCSGTVSYVLHAAGLLKISMDSSEFMSWGGHGLGQWITIYTNPAHAFIEIAGIRLDTSAEGDPHPAPGSGPRWRPLLQDTSGFLVRHPTGY
jgi:cell wall-associated NlpC family hydrolase